MQKVVHSKAPQYLNDLVSPSERLHVHGNKKVFVQNEDWYLLNEFLLSSEQFTSPCQIPHGSKNIEKESLWSSH